MYNLEVPCLNCKDRYIGCHSVCEKYLEYKNSEFHPSSNPIYAYEGKMRTRVLRIKQNRKH